MGFNTPISQSSGASFNTLQSSDYLNGLATLIAANPGTVHVVQNAGGAPVSQRTFP